MGAEDSEYHRRVFLGQRWPYLLLSSLHAIATSPSRVKPLVLFLCTFANSLLQSSSLQELADGVPLLPSASLMMFGVDPDHCQIGIANRLARCFAREMAWRGIDCLKLAVGVSNKDHRLMQCIATATTRIWSTGVIQLAREQPIVIVEAISEAGNQRQGRSGQDYLGKPAR